MNIQILGVGTDIEVFLRNIETKKPVPVCGLLGGTKQEPLALPKLGKGFCVQEDNVAAEFNVPATARMGNFTQNLELMRGWLANHFNEQGLELAVEPSMIFEVDQLKSKQARTFGCDPDFDVWRIESGDFENEVNTSNPLLQKMRTAGGHIHVSFTVDEQPPELPDLLLFVKVLDIYLGIPSVLLDNDTRRKQVYGKAGAFRPKQYTPNIHGVEYRTLSNFWFDDVAYQQWVFQQVYAAREALQCNSHLEEAISRDEKAIIQAINTNNKSVARALIDKWGLSVPMSNKRRRLEAKKGSLHDSIIIDDNITITGTGPNTSIFNWATTAYPILPDDEEPPSEAQSS